MRTALRAENDLKIENGTRKDKKPGEFVGQAQRYYAIHPEKILVKR